MRLTRRALFGIPFAALAQPRRRPNVIVFMTDDHGAWATGAYGCGEIHTPNIDALAKGGANADEVNLHRGIAYQRQGAKEPARTAFAAVQAGPLANIATLYTTSLDLPPLS